MCWALLYMEKGIYYYDGFVNVVIDSLMPIKSEEFELKDNDAVSINEVVVRIS